MNRKSFLRNLGLTSLGIGIPGKFAFSASTKTDNANTDCVLIPSETAGPFALDLSDNSDFLRQDVRESKTGVQLNLKLKILGLENCYPMQNVRVHIWHCDKDGLYSGYNATNNEGQLGKTYLRGWQMTNNNGEVDFVTILPGWYPGRICHIHFQVYVSSSYSAVSQLSFDIDTKNGIYAANSSLYTKGADPVSFSGDNVFADGYQYQLASLSPNATTGGYDSYLEVTVKGSGTLGMGHLEKENQKQFNLGQNYPNPFVEQTTIPFEIKNKSHVDLTLFDLNGKEVYKILNGYKSVGQHEQLIDFKALGLKAQNYLYQLKLSSDNGTHVESKMMTRVKE